MSDSPTRDHLAASLRLLALLVVLLATLGCSEGEPTPGSLAPGLSQTASARTPGPARTASPDLSHASPSPSTAWTGLPLAQSPETSAPADGPSPVPSPELSLTPTLVPSVLISRAERAAKDGNYALAIHSWQEALDAAGPAERPALRISIARCRIEEGEYVQAIIALAQVITATQTVTREAQALGLLGTCYEALGEWQAAVDVYGRYLALEGAAEPHVRWHMARSYEALGEDAEAAEQLGAVDLDTLSLSRRAELLEERAEAYARLKKYEEAHAAYQEILDFARNPTYRALVLGKQAEVLRSVERNQEASEIYTRLVREYSEAPSAALALAALEELGVDHGLDDLEQAQVLMAGGQYADALAAIDLYELANPDGDFARAYYLRGVVSAKLGLYQQAFSTFDRVIDDYPDAAVVGEAWMAKAGAAADYGGDPSGLYYEFVRRYPAHPRAAEALWKAAQWLEREGLWSQAMLFYGRVHADYPGCAQAIESRFREALAAYAEGDTERAYELWSHALEALIQADAPADEQARVMTWMGLAARELGDLRAAREHWRRAAGEAPWSYYGLRAQDLIRDAEPVMPPNVDSSVPPSSLSTTEWREIASWVASWVPESRSEEMPASSDWAHRSHIRRGAALLGLGWHAEALDIFVRLRGEVKDDPQGLLALVQLCSEMELHSQTIACAEQLLYLGSQAADLEPPRPLYRLAYPTIYGHLVSREAEGWAVDPMLFLALVRQESRFNPRAVSYAGATGLTQVMPLTGGDIASRLGIEDYKSEFLTRPMLSVRFGVWYLFWLLDLFERDWFVALVAYNGGPGNAMRWTGERPVWDHDLFYETIPAQQAQDYVSQVYRQYRRYEWLYRQGQPDQGRGP